MLFVKVAIITLVSVLSHANYDGVIKPKIEIFNPKGFSISIEDFPGITSVEFHVTINKGHHEKKLFKDVYHKRDGKWTFTRRRISLEIGNVINYWILIVNNHMGYRINGEYVVTEKEPWNSNTNRPKPTTPCKTEDSSKIPLDHCEKMIINTTQALMSLLQNVETLTKINEQLIKVMEKYPDAKTLTLSGRIPPDDEPLVTVAFILMEKLDLEPTIISAVRNNDNSITFKVSTVIEKLNILDMAKDKLMYSKINIF